MGSGRESFNDRRPHHHSIKQPLGLIVRLPKDAVNYCTQQQSSHVSFSETLI